MPPASSPVLALSSWSVHRALGVTWPDSPGGGRAAGPRETYGPPAMTLLELPARAATLGIGRLEICSFHVDAGDPDEIGRLRRAIGDAGAVLQTLLIDDGDITDPANRQRDMDWIAGWIDVAARLGAERARVIAGKQTPTPETLALSVDGLRELARLGAARGVRVITENWFETLRGPEEVHTVLDRLDGEVGLLVDFGNWKGPTKHAELASVLGRAEGCHAKCHFDSGLAMDADDYRRCLDAAAAAGYDGPYTLIYEGRDDGEWQAVTMERDFVRAHCAGTA